MNSKYRADNFRDNEFECKCGCGLNEMNQNTVKKLDLARDIAGVPFRLTSAYRCEKHNKEIGGVEDSSHLKGLAVDIYFSNNNQKFLILYGLITVGFRRIGIGKDFIHVDYDLSKKQDVIWGYDE